MPPAHSPGGAHSRRESHGRLIFSNFSELRKCLESFPSCPAPPTVSAEETVSLGEVPLSNSPLPRSLYLLFQLEVRPRNLHLNLAFQWASVLQAAPHRGRSPEVHPLQNMPALSSANLKCKGLCGGYPWFLLLVGCHLDRCPQSL